MANQSSLNSNKKNKQRQTAGSANKPGEVIIAAIICFTLAFLLYSNTFRHGYVMDDYSVVAENSFVQQGLAGIPIIFKTTYRAGVNILGDNIYRPFSLAMFAAEWQISPNNPHLNHVINVIFYAISCMLLFLVLKKLAARMNIVVPFLITVLFIVHPVHTEVVAYIKSRDEVMSFFFLMITLLMLSYWFEKAKWWSLACAMAAYFAALLSKEGVIMMLFIFPLAGWYFTNSAIKHILTATGLMIVPAILYILIRFMVISSTNSAGHIPLLDNFLAGAPDFVSGFATEIMLLGRYLMLILFPYQLACDYSFNQIKIIGPQDITFLMSFVIYIGMIVFSMIKFRKKDPVIFGIITFLVTISIYSNIFFLTGSSFAERFMFLPSLGICISMVLLGFKIFRTDLFKQYRDPGQFLSSSIKPVLIFVLVITVFSVKTVIRAAEWKDPLTLFSSDIYKSPESARVNLNLGMAIKEKIKTENDARRKDSLSLRAIELFTRSVEIYPQYLDGFDQLGLMFYQLKDTVKARENYDKALKISPRRAETLNNMPGLYFDRGDYNTAIRYYEAAIKSNGRFASAYLNLGSALGSVGRYREAITNFLLCIKYDPGNATACKMIALSYQGLGYKDTAAQWFDKASLMKQKTETAE